MCRIQGPSGNAPPSLSSRAPVHGIGARLKYRGAASAVADHFDHRGGAQLSGTVDRCAQRCHLNVAGPLPGQRRSQLPDRTWWRQRLVGLQIDYDLRWWQRELRHRFADALSARIVLCRSHANLGSEVCRHGGDAFVVGGYDNACGATAQGLSIDMPQHGLPGDVQQHFAGQPRRFKPRGNEDTEVCRVAHSDRSGIFSSTEVAKSSGRQASTRRHHRGGAAPSGSCRRQHLTASFSVITSGSGSSKHRSTAR